MKRKTSKVIARFLLALLIPVVLSGCWERQELNEIAIVLGIGLDKAESGYTITYQVVIPSAIGSQAAGGGGGNGVPVVLYKFTVPTMYEAQRQFNLDSARKGYLGHIRVLVIGEELARAGVGETLDIFKRSREPRMDFYVMVAQGTTAENVLNVLTPLDKLPANKLFSSLDKSYKISAKTVAVTLDRFIEDLLDEGKNPVLTGVDVVGDSSEGGDKTNIERITPKAKLYYHSIAVFKKDKLIGWLDDKETIGYNYIIDKVITNSSPVTGEDGKAIIIEALKTSTQRKVKFIDGEPHIYLNVKAICNVEEVQSKENLEAESTIRKLERAMEKRIVGRMQNAVEQIIKRYNVDILGFGQLIYRSSPKTWSRLQHEKGDDYLKSLPIHYKATVIINRIGTMDKSFFDEIKE